MRTFVLLTFVSLVAVFILIPLIIFCWLTGLNQIIIYASKGVLRVCLWVTGIKLEVHGLDKVDRKLSYVFMSNHLSIIDGPLLFMLIPLPVRVLLKKEAFRIPIIGLGMKQAAFVPVDRKGLKGGKRSIDRATRLMKEKKFSFLIFPEGTRSRDGFLQQFKRGGFFLAVNSQVPILPLSLKGTYKSLPKGNFFVRKAKVRVVFHEPVPVHEYSRDNLMQLVNGVRNAIQSGLS